jgi:hypothetical protein
MLTSVNIKKEFIILTILELSYSVSSTYYQKSKS